MGRRRRAQLSAMVAGGSVGGLVAAEELGRIGAEVTVFERSAGQIQARGAGIVMQPEVEDLLGRVGSSAEAVSVPVHTRQRIDRSGQVRSFAAPQLMTSWGALYRVLRNALSADVSYLLDRELVATVERDGQIDARFSSGDSAAGDLLIGADGIGSTARQAAGIPGEVDYAGYLAWRGLEPENSLPGSLVDRLDDSFTFFGVPGLQFLAYLVPGPTGRTERGSRQVNWVWYVNTGAEVMNEALIGNSGRQYRAFLPPGETQPRVREALRGTAREHLPSVLTELVEASNVFMQPVFDVPYARMRAGRTILIGDAAGTVRPHTASGTSKAFGDARVLARALVGASSGRALPEQRLDRWEQERRNVLRRTARSGIDLASSSMLGTAPRYLKELAQPNKPHAVAVKENQ